MFLANTHPWLNQKYISVKKTLSVCHAAVALKSWDASQLMITSPWPLIVAGSHTCIPHIKVFFRPVPPNDAKPGFSSKNLICL